MMSENEINKEAFKFTDIYITVDNPLKSYIYNKKGNEPSEINFSDKEIKEEMFNFFKTVNSTINKNKHKKDHLIKYKGRNFRGFEIETIDGKIIAIRQMPPDFIHLKDTGIDQRIIEELTSPRLRQGGLIIICGAPGNGKTTTCAAVIDARLKKSGGLCITVEDPVEIPLQGNKGKKGKCLQIQAESKDDFPKIVRGIMRAYPTGVDSIMLIGETRDGETASEALRSSIDGRLVITTMHANSPIEALQRFHTLASKSMDSDEVLKMMASSFRIALHQRLVKNKMIAKVLIDETEVSGAILNDKFGSLKTHIEHQQKKIELKKPFEYKGKI